MSPSGQRQTLRIVHLAAAGALGFFVYAPNDVTDGTFELLTAVVFFPVLALTGLWTWLGQASSGR